MHFRILALFLIAFSAPAHADMALQEVFNSAVSHTEALPIQGTLAEQASERVRQARGGIFPAISLLGTYTRQDQPEVQTGGSVGSAFSRPDQYNARLNLTQPLFRGLREFAALGSAQAQHRAADANLEQARLGLYAAVAQAYYEVLASQRDVGALQTQLELTRKRVSELQGRVRIGRSRRAELFLAQAQEATVSSELRSAEAALERAREQLALQAGVPAEEKLVDDSEQVPGKPQPLSAYVARKEERPDLKARQALAEAADENVSVAWGQHLPSLDFAGNYYIRRTGVLEQVKWDLGVTLTLPLFQGGVIHAQVREAAQARRQSELELAQARRSAETDIRTLHQGLVAALEQVKLLGEANALTEKNYHEQRRDYESGLVTNLDVFQALDSAYDTRRALDRARCQAKAAAAALETSVGRMPTS